MSDKPASDISTEAGSKGASSSSAALHLRSLLPVLAQADLTLLLILQASTLLEALLARSPRSESTEVPDLTETPVCLILSISS
jgi:hypothetical protein